MIGLMVVHESSVGDERDQPLIVVRVLLIQIGLCKGWQPFVQAAITRLSLDIGAVKQPVVRLTQPVEFVAPISGIRLFCKIWQSTQQVARESIVRLGVERQELADRALAQLEIAVICLLIL